MEIKILIVAVFILGFALGVNLARTAKKQPGVDGEPSCPVDQEEDSPLGGGVFSPAPLI